jgi:catabolite regulation protein CreA
MFTERIPLVFKKLRVVRMVDARCNSLMCLPIPTA